MLSQLNKELVSQLNKELDFERADGIFTAIRDVDIKKTKSLAPKFYKEQHYHQSKQGSYEIRGITLKSFGRRNGYGHSNYYNSSGYYNFEQSSRYGNYNSHSGHKKQQGRIELKQIYVKDERELSLLEYVVLQNNPKLLDCFEPMAFVSYDQISSYTVFPARHPWIENERNYFGNTNRPSFSNEYSGLVEQVQKSPTHLLEFTVRNKLDESFNWLMERVFCNYPTFMSYQVPFKKNEQYQNDDIEWQNRVKVRDTIIDTYGKLLESEDEQKFNNAVWLFSNENSNFICTRFLDVDEFFHSNENLKIFVFIVNAFKKTSDIERKRSLLSCFSKLHETRIDFEVFNQSVLLFKQERNVEIKKLLFDEIEKFKFSNDCFKGKCEIKEKAFSSKIDAYLSEGGIYLSFALEQILTIKHEKGVFNRLFFKKEFKEEMFKKFVLNQCSLEDYELSFEIKELLHNNEMNIRMQMNKIKEYIGALKIVVLEERLEKAEKKLERVQKERIEQDKLILGNSRRLSKVEGEAGNVGANTKRTYSNEMKKIGSNEKKISKNTEQCVVLKKESQALVERLRGAEKCCEELKEENKRLRGNLERTSLSLVNLIQRFSILEQQVNLSKDQESSDLTASEINNELDYASQQQEGENFKNPQTLGSSFDEEKFRVLTFSGENKMRIPGGGESNYVGDVKSTENQISIGETSERVGDNNKKEKLMIKNL